MPASTSDSTISPANSTGFDDIHRKIEAALRIFENERLKSFANWHFDENQKCSASEMAKAGWYFIGDDSACCFVCNKQLDGWEEDDDPWIEHEKHAANCQFVQMRREEDDLTVEEFLDLFKYITKQYLIINYNSKEAIFAKNIEKIRDIIKNQQF